MNLKNKNIEKIGVLVVFYIPSKKITKSIRQKIHDFFVSKHKAYTHECGDIIGYWSNDTSIVKDKHERYEISLKEKEISDLIVFIESLCEEIQEKCIYLTIKNESYLVYHKDSI